MSDDLKTAVAGVAMGLMACVLIVGMVVIYNIRNEAQDARWERCQADDGVLVDDVCFARDAVIFR